MSNRQFRQFSWYRIVKQAITKFAKTAYSAYFQMWLLPVSLKYKSFEKTLFRMALSTSRYQKNCRNFLFNIFSNVFYFRFLWCTNEYIGIPLNGESALEYLILACWALFSPFYFFYLLRYKRNDRCYQQIPTKFNRTNVLLFSLLIKLLTNCKFTSVNATSATVFVIARSTALLSSLI